MRYDAGMDKLKIYLDQQKPGPLARKLGVSLQALRNWKQGINYPSPANAMLLDEVSGGLVSKSELYPDLWPPIKDTDAA